MKKTKISYWKYMSSFSRFISYLYYWTYNIYTLNKKFNKIVQEPDWLFVSFWNLKSLLLLTLICFHSFYHSLSFAVIHCHFLLLIVIRCHSLSLIVPLVVTRCSIRCHSLSFVVTHCITRRHRCHSMYHSSVFLETIIDTYQKICLV